ncbi:hypothetical protein FIBSPDRAFT_764447 [Athelia psychrophila]|uniref:Uncharacterized protein n=1 Tax=Athelia psychrophila TaxID=1759441 RepID=A0A167WSG5_9AGAM|nr:hypothetical protein FIBSPDRAFT_764447 [Fibularhizoctonia sp. CBS 109695]
MQPRSFWALALVVVALSSVDTRPVDTNITSNITSIPTANLSLSTISDLTNATTSPQGCIYIKTCRTLHQIVGSCVVTIFACAWFAVHRNIPAPKPPPSRIPNVFFRFAHWARSFVQDQREPAIVLVVALLAPEWILAWALRQALVARRLTRKLEKARSKAIAAQIKRRITVLHPYMDADGVPRSSDGHSSLDRSAANQTDEHIQLIRVNRHRNTPQRAWSLIRDQRESAIFYNKSGPLRPLSPEDVLELVSRGHLVPPTAEEISNQSKGDVLSKGVAIIQTLWFVIQCIVRRAEGLPVTSLEVMTLAYTVMTVAMYITWWDKPLNVACAVRVPEEEVEYSGGSGYDSRWMQIYIYVMGGQDEFVDLRQCKRVPTFWAGGANDTDAENADVIALLVTMAFGAVHCIAWYSEFQTPLELLLWRLSAITIIAVPVALAVVLLGGMALANSEEHLFIIVGPLYMVIGIIYTAARFILIILSFISLRGLPVGAYQTIQWTTWIPHI